MILIGDEIIKVLQEKLTFPKVSVRDFYAVSKVAPPMVTINELPGEGVLFPDGQPKIVRNSFQVEVYCKQASGPQVMTAIAAAKALMLEVDAVLNSEFGLTQVGDAPFAPYMADESIIRGVARYRGDIDTRTQIIYR